MSINEALHSICPSFSVKIALGIGLFNNALNAMGSERHLEYYKAAWNREVSFALKFTLCFFPLVAFRTTLRLNSIHFQSQLNKSLIEMQLQTKKFIFLFTFSIHN